MMTPVGSPPDTTSRAAIAALLPHAGAMSLLDRVLACDGSRIRCASMRHREPGNPLAEADGSLGAACLVEFAAQAVALHAALVAGGGDEPRPGMLVSLAGLELAPGRVDTIGDELQIEAERESVDAAAARYAFSVRAGTARLADGVATVVLAAPAPGGADGETGR